MEVQNTFEQYLQIKGLSHTGMKALAISPLRYWHLFVNPDRPVTESTPAQKLGTALHCAVLEPEEFPNRYVEALDETKYPGALRTIEHLRDYLRKGGETPKGTKKDDVIKQVLAMDPEAPVWDVITSEYGRINTGKIMLFPDEWERVTGMAAAVTAEPFVQQVMKTGRAEVTKLGELEGIPVKCRLDWVNDEWVIDLKTLAAPKNKPIDKAVALAIMNEQYYRQAYLYRTLCGRKRFAFVFVESEPPYDVRVRELGPVTDGSVNLYWEMARLEVKKLLQTYAEYSKHFGEKPWRYAQEVAALRDEEMPAMAY